VVEISLGLDVTLLKRKMDFRVGWSGALLFSWWRREILLQEFSFVWVPETQHGRNTVRAWNEHGASKLQTRTESLRGEYVYETSRVREQHGNGTSRVRAMYKNGTNSVGEL